MYNVQWWIQDFLLGEGGLKNVFVWDILFITLQPEIVDELR
jgi:hypothetical protein